MTASVITSLGWFLPCQTPDSSGGDYYTRVNGTVTATATGSPRTDTQNALKRVQ
ncbi:MAG: hypothetical protein M1140_06340 [Chloroflexi bacterium]|nr:hypothetical protein [Chloroflexota bacterium]